jgi:hypothetical protein
MKFLAKAKTPIILGTCLYSLYLSEPRPCRPLVKMKAFNIKTLEDLIKFFSL